MNLRSLLTITLFFLAALPACASEWHQVSLAARPFYIVENHGDLWISGADELIANSTDGGKTWSTRHSAKSGGILLTLGFANERFGYAAGTGGQILITKDGGTTWATLQAPAQLVYDLSFSDERHGILHAARSIYTTADGGATWTPVKIDFENDDLRKFVYVARVLALDAEHMAIVLGEGDAPYHHQIFLVTKDGGTNWKTVDVPSTGLQRLSKHDGQYWFLGFEVIEKDKPGGGYSVPLVMRSVDGEEWTHLPRWSEKGFSTCTAQGCLYWDGAAVELPPGNPVSYWTFPAEKAVTAKWAVAKGGICAIATDLKCAPVVTTQTMPSYTDNSSSIAPTHFPPALNAPPAQGLQCISCEFERMMVTQKFQGPAEVELKLHIAPNGLVEKVEILHSTAAEIADRVVASARNWIFVPYTKEGVPHSVVTNVTLRVMAIKSH
jgi:hypothetical protein